jgi:hypothetical protein
MNPCFMSSIVVEASESRCTSNADCEIDELRRSFIDSIAYICDYEKGRDTVTAAALQREPVGVTVWLAANTHVK